ncbi:MAG: DUF2666 family protein [Candidatus Micrarchaeaceae archaeon]
MAGHDSLDFAAKYRGWSVSWSLPVLPSTDPKEVALFLIKVREEVDRRAFEILGLDLKAIDAYSEKVIGKLPKNEYTELVGIYKSLGSPEAEEAVNRATNMREELKPFAKAYILRSALEKLGIDHYIRSGSRVFSGLLLAKSDGSTLQSECIIFMAKYGDWISIKKMSITKDTKPEEVAAHLSSIRIAADRKAAQILGIDTEALDAYAAGLTGNMRKSAANLEKIAKALGEAGAASAVEKACKGNKTLSEAAKVYLFSTMLNNLKLDLEVSPDTLMEMFPGLKIPKPKGNFGGRRKK